MNPIKAQGSSTGSAKQGKRSLLLFLLGLSVMVMGLGFSALLLRGYHLAKDYDDWVAHPARILASWIEPVPQPGGDPPRYRLKVRYTYTVDGKDWSSSRWRDVEGNSRRRSKLEVLQKTYRPGTEVTAFVDPMNPQDAVLQRPTKAPAYTLWFPGLFVIAGAGICVAALRRGHRKMS